MQLRAREDETQGFVTFIALAFHPDNTPLQHISKTTGFDDIRNIAVARLVLDNVPHIKACLLGDDDSAGRADRLAFRR